MGDNRHKIGKALVPESQIQKVLNIPVKMRDLDPPEPPTAIDKAVTRIVRQIQDMSLELARLSRIVAGGAASETRLKTARSRLAFAQQQRTALQLLQDAFVATYPDRRLTADVLRSRSRQAWMVEARRIFVWLLDKTRPDITAVDIGALWSRDGSTITHLRMSFDRSGMSVERLEQIEEAWLAATGAAFVTPTVQVGAQMNKAQERT